LVIAWKKPNSLNLAQNQGLYNGFLAAGLFWALIAPETYAVALANFFLVCVLIAGIYGAVTASKKKLFISNLYPHCLP
jgi:putative membrane protein